MMNEVKIASWNVWGLGISKKRGERIKGIKEHLTTLNADVILLQELWKRADYENIKEALGDAYKGIRFEGGIVGCGLAVFIKVSSVQVVDGSVGFKAFSVRGRLWRFWEGDWFAGKGYLYLSVTQTGSSIPIHIVNTHLQSSYGEKYAVERAVQLLEIAEHLNNSSRFYVLAGDLNTHPEEVLPWTMLSQKIAVKETNEEQKPTCNVPGNTWSGKKATAQVIDHILISPSLSSNDFAVKDIQLNGMSISDHSLLTTNIIACDNAASSTPATLSLESVVAMNEALGRQVQHLRRVKTIWGISSGFALLVCLGFAISASVLAMADPTNAIALTVVMAILAPLGAALSLLFLAFALDAKNSKAALKNRMILFSGITSQVVAIPLITKQ